MSPNRSTPALDKALAALRDLVTEARRSRQLRLPTVAQIRMQTGLSTVTICKALKMLKQRGEVIATPGGGIRASAAPQALSEPPTRTHRSFTPRWRSIADCLSAGILDGTYRPGRQLPTTTELCRQFGAHSRTVRRALQWLADQHRVEPHGRGFAVVRPRASRTSSAIVLIGVTDSLERIATLTPSMPALYRSLERECLHANTTLQVTGLRVALGERRSEAPDHLSFPEIHRRYSVLGYVVVTSGMQFRMPHRIDEVRRLARQLRSTGKPVAILGEEPRCVLCSDYPTGPRYRIFRSSGKEAAGTLVGNHLLTLGHREVAYICPYGRLVWSQARLSGIQRSFAAVRAPDTVHQLVFQTQIPERLYKKIDDSTGNPLVRERLHSALHGEQIHTQLAPRLEKLLTRSRITAWVAANDRTGLLCMEYLRDKGLRPGRDISVAGFDDTFEASVKGLTSYDDNMPALVLAMLDFILGVQARRSRQGWAGIVEVPGVVLQRGSTGPPSRHSETGG